MLVTVTVKTECITGHHVYKDIWKPVIGETLTCDIEPQNIHDPLCRKRYFSGSSCGTCSTIFIKHYDLSIKS